LALLLFLNSILRIEKVRFTSSFAFYSIFKIRAFLRCFRAFYAPPFRKALVKNITSGDYCQAVF
jgi:hypothetical protein